MPIEWSVLVSAQAGYNTVTLPSPGVLVGVFHAAQYIAIQLDPSHQAIIPGRPTNASTPKPGKPYVPVVWQITANTFQFYSPIATGVVFYFGVPDSDAVPLSALVGVAQTVTLSNSGTSASPESTTVTFNFLGNARLIGALFNALDTVTGYSISFTTSPGYSLTFSADWTTSLAYDLSSVIPLADIPVAQQLSVSVSAASVPAGGSTSMVIVFYYRVI